MKINRILFSILIALTLTIGIFAQKAKIESVYTSLETKACKTLEQRDDEGGWYLGECKGIGGYKLQVTEGDIRQSINIVSPNRKIFELNFTQNVSSAFSSVGAQAEWRVTRKGKTLSPIALIVRYNASENPEDSSVSTSYLVVAKITKNEICITNVVKPDSKANEEARTLADSAATAPCKTFEN